MEPLRPLFARPLEPLRAGTLPTNAADVGTDSEAPRLEKEDGTSYDKPVGNSMIDEAAPQNGVPGLHREGESEDDDERMIYSPAGPSKPRCPSSESEEDAARMSAHANCHSP